jgi:hypothetical protein
MARRGAGARGRHDAAAQSAVGSKTFQSTPVRMRKSPNILTEVHKVVNRKVVNLTALYNFYKGSIVFLSTNFAQAAAKL